jgi:hypothetical protein
VADSILQFFVRYTQDTKLRYGEDENGNDGSWDEDRSVWTLVQWGIPEGQNFRGYPADAMAVQSSQVSYG